MLAPPSQDAVRLGGIERWALRQPERLEIAGAEPQREPHALARFQLGERPAVFGSEEVGNPPHGAPIIRPGGFPMRAPSQPELYRPRLSYPDLPYGALLDRPVLLYPEREAIAFKDASITFRELEGLVNAFANTLRGLGIGRGDRVCLFGGFNEHLLNEGDEATVKEEVARCLDAAMDGGGYVLRSTGQIFFTKPGMIEVMCDTARELGVYR